MGIAQPGLVDLSAILRESHELEALPASAARLAGLIAEGSWRLESLCETVRLDQALTGRLLGAANSVLSGSRHPISTVEQAVVRLGPGTVLSLAIGGRVRRRMLSPLPEYGLSEGELWTHSVASALAVDRARFHCKTAIAREGFPAALLHDLGKLLLARYLDTETIAILQRACEEGGLSTEEAEREVLRVDHAELGALVTRQWKLPESISVAIQHHHSPFSAPSEESRHLSVLLNLADAAATQLGASCGEAHPPPAFSPALAGSLGMTREGFDALCREVEDALEEVLLVYA